MLYLIIMLLAVCLIFFAANFIDVSIVGSDDEEMEKIREARRKNPKNVYFILIALALTVLNLLLIRLAPDKPMPGSGLDIFYDAMSLFAFLLYFSGVYFFVKKLVSGEPPKRRFLTSVILVNFCLWPLLLFTKTVS